MKSYVEELFPEQVCVGLLKKLIMLYMYLKKKKSKLLSP